MASKVVASHWNEVVSLVLRPPPRFYLTAMEKNLQLRDKTLDQAWEQGYRAVALKGICLLCL